MIGLKLSELHRLQKKHEVRTCEELIEKRNSLSKNLGSDQNYQDRIHTLERQLDQLLAKMTPLADELSQNRIRAAKELSRSIQDVLMTLEMPSAQMKIEVDSKKSFLSTGKDEVQFKFQANKGSELHDLKQVISGGELSRLSLAVQYVKGETKVIPTQVFDEIDTGVSGQVAERVAQLFDLMGKRHQLLVITHLPQVAAKGATHLKIFKKEWQERTYTTVKKLSLDDREYEIASMIEGNNPSETALSHARTLLTKR
jgi:DNA repair protein RecN (Recombination protein N)